MTEYFAGGDEFLANRKWDFPFVRTVDDLRFVIGSGSLAGATEVRLWLKKSPRAGAMPEGLRSDLDSWLKKEPSKVSSAGKRQRKGSDAK